MDHTMNLLDSCWDACDVCLTEDHPIIVPQSTSHDMIGIEASSRQLNPSSIKTIHSWDAIITLLAHNRPTTHVEESTELSLVAEEVPLHVDDHTR